MGLGLYNTAKWVLAAGSGGTGIANDVPLGMCCGCPASGYLARTQRRRHHMVVIREILFPLQNYNVVALTYIAAKTNIV